MEVSRTSDFGSYPNGSAALLCNGGKVQVQSLGAGTGHSYNGYYSGLLIRQIRVRIPGGPYDGVSEGQDAAFITGGSSTGRALKNKSCPGILTANKNCSFTAEVIGSNPIHRSAGYMR